MHTKITTHLIKKANAYLYKNVYELRGVITSNGSTALTEKKYDAFQSLVRSIISQQLSNKAATAIFDRLKNISKNNTVTPYNLIGHSTTKLRSIGISNSKAKYIQNLASYIIDGKLDFDALSSMSDNNVIELLTEINGIGRWTAEMFLIFYLKRSDVVSVSDMGIKRAVQKVYGMMDKPTDKQLLSISNKWKPYRSVACWHLWKSLG